MNTPGRTILLALTLLLGPVACNRRCQAPLQERPASITSFPWRLISTTNPRVTKLDKFNFTVLTFTKNNHGDIKAVQSNTQYDTPLYTFDYLVSNDTASSGILRLVYQTVPKTEEGTDSAPPPPAEQSKPIDYQYTLSREFTMTETNTGFQYVYVPFQGIVDPDNNCTF